MAQVHHTPKTVGVAYMNTRSHITNTSKIHHFRKRYWIVGVFNCL